MAETSFPFDADNANGGSRVVSQTQWQKMAVGWGADRIDYSMVNTSYVDSDLPFSVSVTGRQVVVSAGNAWVGGFYYSLSDAKTFNIPDNTSNKPRRDMIVLRADMATSSVNMVLVQGTPATQPVEPMPARQAGGVWEMALHAIEAPANNGTLATYRRAPFNVPERVAFPWFAEDSATLIPRNSLVYDVDVNATGGQEEGFSSRDGFVVARHLSKSQNYTPGLLFTGSVPADKRTGRWRWMAPNMFWFQATIRNDSSRSVSVTGSNWRAGITLPRASNRLCTQVLHGYLANPDHAGNLPNIMSVTATTGPGSTTLYLHTPNPNSASGGLDGVATFPAGSYLYVSGVVEANEFNE